MSSSQDEITHINKFKTTHQTGSTTEPSLKNKQQFKNYLINDVDERCRELLDSITEFEKNSVLPHYSIRFSDEIIEKTTKFYSDRYKYLTKAQNKMRKLDIPIDIITSGNPNNPKNYFYEDSNDIPNLEEKKRNIKRTEIRNIRKILSQIPFKYKLFGIFDSVNMQIVIYTKAIQKYCNYRNFITENIAESVFTHELFHLIHYLYVSFDECGNEYENSVVKESLASYFQKKYLDTYMQKDVGKAYSESLFSSWNRHDMNIFPYSGARYIGKYVPSVIKKMPDCSDYCFNMIFKKSLTSFDAAYKYFKNARDIEYELY